MIYAIVLGEFIAICILAVQVGRLSEKVDNIKPSESFIVIAGGDGGSSGAAGTYSSFKGDKITITKPTELTFKDKISKEEKRIKKLPKSTKK